MDLFELIDDVTELTDSFVGKMGKVNPEQLGLVVSVYIHVCVCMC